NLCRVVRQFRIPCVADRINVQHPTPGGVTEQHTNVCPVVCAAFRATRKRAEPVVDFFNSNSGNLSVSKVSTETYEAFFQVANVRRAHPILSLRVEYLCRQL